MDNRTEPLADGVWRIEVGPSINAYLVAHDRRGDGAGLTLVDTGTRGAGPRLVRSIRMLGLDPRAVDQVLLTHWHPDHVGSAARFAASGAAPAVAVGAEDLEIVRGTAPPPRPGPADTTTLGRILTRVVRPATPVPSARGLADGERVEASGAEVLDTPGHTRGHVAFWLPDTGMLLAGDALWTLGRVTQGPRTLCSALSRRAETIQRLARLDPAVLAVGHGPPVRTEVGRRLRRLAGRAGRPVTRPAA